MNKNAVVTGGTRGIGKAISDKLLNLGYNVLSCDRKMGDLSTDNGINKLVDIIDFDVDVLVNNAAFTKFIPHKNLDELDDETFDKIFNVNVKAPFKLIKKLKNKFTENSCIINIGSVAGITGNGSNIAYCASKASIISMTKSLARCLAPIRVNSVSPGLIKTDFVKFPDEYYEKTIEKTPIPRIGKPEDVANVVVGLVNSDYVTGENIVVDGGRILN
jgi:3-oxoacyl-[acyl-carrier protein] reductase